MKVNLHLFGPVPSCPAEATRYWEKVNRHRGAIKEDARQAVAALYPLWKTGDTWARNTLRNRTTPLERTLVALWPYMSEANAARWSLLIRHLHAITLLLAHEHRREDAEASALAASIAEIHRGAAWEAVVRQLREKAA